MEPFQAWVLEHKLTSIGVLWASGIGGSLAYSMARSPLKPSLRLIHARMHAQALTLGVLSAAAIFHYYEKRASQQAEICSLEASKQDLSRSNNLRNT